jgi:hypothetical protein
MRLWKHQPVVASDRKLVRLASTVTRREYMWMVVSRNFEHVTHLVGGSMPGISNFEPEKLTAPYSGRRKLLSEHHPRGCGVQFVADACLRELE